MAVLRAAAAGRDRLKSISGGAKVDAFTREGRARVREVVVAERSGRLRFETLSPFEQPLSTLTSDGKNFALYELEKKRFYRGRATPMNISRLLPIRMRGEELAQLLLGEPPLVAAQPSALEVDRCESHYKLTFENKALGARQEVVIDATRPVPLKSTVWADGRVAYRLTFEDHKLVDGVLIPHKIRYVSPDDKVDILVLYTDVTVNETFENDLFRLELPKGIEPIEID